jgi:hypothetical protein
VADGHDTAVSEYPLPPGSGAIVVGVQAAAPPVGWLVVQIVPLSSIAMQKPVVGQSTP